MPGMYRGSVGRIKMDFGTVVTFGAAAAAGLDAAAFGSVRREEYRLLVAARCGLGAGMVPELNRGLERRVEFGALARFGVVAAEGFVDVQVLAK